MDQQDQRECPREDFDLAALMGGGERTENHSPGVLDRKPKAKAASAGKERPQGDDEVLPPRAKEAPSDEPLAHRAARAVLEGREQS